MKQISIKTTNRVELVDITPEVQKAVKEAGIGSGVCHVFVPHTTAGVTINEGADPNVARDIENFLTKLVPHGAGFAHAEGNSDSHIKTVLTGSSETIFVEGGRLVLGTWQAVYLCEYDGPRARKVLVKVRG
jgi:secondary thiamine-phosphate synthase enzyme